jgi:uncharacterized protein YbjT (DUF2867 family)
MTNTQHTHSSQHTLVLGGTGKTGRRVVERLEARGVPVRVGSRSATPAFDWEDQSTWRPALVDVEAVYVTFYPDLAYPGATNAIRAFTEAAVAAGVRRLVLLSGRGEPEAQACEEIVQSYDIDWTCVRSSFFAQNFSEDFVLDPVRSGTVALPVDGTPEAFIDVDDIADVVVAALTEPGHERKLYEVTGPRLMTFDEAVGEISEASGRDVRYVPISGEAYHEALLEAGLPVDLADFLSDLFATIFDGRNEYVADGVQQALGRPPRDFTEYARKAAASGVWSA